jgi:2,3-bisphosphoglycerate-independent phosphoglycerate mutase
MPTDLKQNLLSKATVLPPIPHPPLAEVSHANPQLVTALAEDKPIPHNPYSDPTVIEKHESNLQPKQSLNKHIFKKVVLVILDGFGVASPSHGNAIYHAHRPTLDYLVGNFPSLTLHASGPLVGLPWGEMGNSEVGHLNIGAGRIVGQDLPRITTSIQNGEFFKNQAFLDAILHVNKNNSKLHLVGMVSSGGVHSLDQHLYALLSLAEDKGINQVYIHMFTDGRDTEEKVALEDIKKLRQKISKIGVGEIATLTGRFYAMDRGGHWNQTNATYEALVFGKGEMAHSAEDAVWKNYQNSIYDEMIKPTVICELGPSGGEYPVAKIDDNDAVIFFNFRPDRALQLTQAFVEPEKLAQNFKHPRLKNLYFATMTEYSQNLKVPVAFPHVNLKNNLAEFLSNNNVSQFHISESEKFAHVTSFFDCGFTEPLPHEERKIIASPDNGRNYVDHPEMSAEELTDTLINKISSTQCKFFVANFANADMVGHTGSLKAGIKAVESLDKQIKTILEACLENEACLIITADHGNIEQMINLKTGNIDKDHTTNPVPLLMAGSPLKFLQTKDRNFMSLSAETPAGAICDIAPTILDLLGMKKPAEMTGVSLMQSIGNF